MMRSDQFGLTKLALLALLGAWEPPRQGHDTGRRFRGVVVA